MVINILRKILLGLSSFPQIGLFLVVVVQIFVNWAVILSYVDNYKNPKLGESPGLG